MEGMGMMGKFYQVSSWMMQLLIMNIIWLLFNFPIIYLMLSTLTVTNMDDLYLVVLTIIILLPFIFFPATTAMYAVVRQRIYHKEEVNIFRYYVEAYRRNYLRSVTGGLVIMPLWIIWFINYHLLQIDIGSALSYVYLVFTVFLLAFTSYFFADTVHFHVKFLSSIKKAFMISVALPHYTISIIGVSGIVLYVLYQIHPLMVVLFGGILPAVVCFVGYYFIFVRAQRLKTVN